MVEPMETNSIIDPENGKTPNLSDEAKSQNAETLKNSGNDLYKQQKYQEALKMYSEAIRLIPHNAAYYGNRSATYMMLHKFNDALEDAKLSTQIDSEFTKGYLREGKCFIALGKPFAALQSFHRALVLEPTNSMLLKEKDIAMRLRSFEMEAQRHFLNKDFRRAEYCMKQCLNEAPSAHPYKLFRAECLTYQGKYTDASEIANSVLQLDRQNSDALFVRGLCLYYEDQIEKAQTHFRQVLKFNPDHTKSKEAFKMSRQLLQKKEEGNEAFKSRNYEAAIQLYTEALEIDFHNKFTNAKLYNNRATCNAKLHKLDQVIADCTRAIELDDKYIKAFQRRAKAYTDREQYEEALREYEAVNKLEPSRENGQAVKQAKLEVKKSKRKDYYKILRVGKDVSDDELKRAYRRRAMAHHPDRHSHDTPEKQLEEEKIFKDVGEAYSVLSDPRKKARYDSGADIEDMEGGAGFADASNLFEMFFGGSQGGDFHFASHGGRGGGGQHGFPGNFF